jgi:hypothetical protein
MNWCECFLQACLLNLIAKVLIFGFTIYQR